MGKVSQWDVQTKVLIMFQAQLLLRDVMMDAELLHGNAAVPRDTVQQTPSL